MANEHYKALSDLRLRVRDQLDESSASFWTDAQLNRYINRAKDRVWNRLKAANEYYCTVTRTSNDGALTIQGESYTASAFRIVAGTSDYVLPPDLDTLSIIECITSGYEDLTFTRIDINDPEFRAARSLTDNQTPGGEVFFDIINEPPSVSGVSSPNAPAPVSTTGVVRMCRRIRSRATTMSARSTVESIARSVVIGPPGTTRGPRTPPSPAGLRAVNR